jgi:hypothetical protein
MKISLFEYERAALERVNGLFAPDPDLVQASAATLKMLRDIFDHLTKPEADYRSGRVAVIGLTNHTHHLFVGGLQSLVEGNAHVWSACLRGLIETFGACVMIEESPQIAPNFLGDNIKAGKLRAAAERAQPGMGADLDRLNSIVHPASGAVHAGFAVLDRENRIAGLQFGYRVQTQHDGCEGVAALANTTILITERIERIAQNDTILSAGKTIMVRASEFDGDAGG